MLSSFNKGSDLKMKKEFKFWKKLLLCGLKTKRWIEKHIQKVCNWVGQYIHKFHWEDQAVIKASWEDIKIFIKCKISVENRIALRKNFVFFRLYRKFMPTKIGIPNFLKLSSVTGAINKGDTTYHLQIKKVKVQSIRGGHWCRWGIKGAPG